MPPPSILACHLRKQNVPAVRNKDNSYVSTHGARLRHPPTCAVSWPPVVLEPPTLSRHCVQRNRSVARRRPGPQRLTQKCTQSVECTVLDLVDSWSGDKQPQNPRNNRSTTDVHPRLEMYYRQVRPHSSQARHAHTSNHRQRRLQTNP